MKVHHLLLLFLDSFRHTVLPECRTPQEEVN